MKHMLHVPYINRLDLLDDAVASALPLGNIHAWANGVELHALPAEVSNHKIGLMSYTSLMNHFIQYSTDNDCDVFFMMHNDVLLGKGVAEEFLAFVRNEWAQSQDWGIIMTHYDLLCAYNLKAMRATGWWDVMWMMYTSDNDYFRRLKLGGWRQIEAGGQFKNRIVHRNSDPKLADDKTQTPEHVNAGEYRRGGSNTFKNDADLRKQIEYRTRSGFDSDYYKFKWGGVPGRETTAVPFSDPYADERKA